MLTVKEKINWKQWSAFKRTHTIKITNEIVKDDVGINEKKINLRNEAISFETISLV